MKQIDNIKDNNILKIEQLCLDYKIRIGVKTTDFQVLECLKIVKNYLKFQFRTKINKF